MSGSQQFGEIERVGLNLIECTRQPGKLRISKHACALRYGLAQKKGRKIPKDEFAMSKKAHLKICRTCPVGRIHLEAFRKKSSRTKRNTRPVFLHKSRAYLGRGKKAGNEHRDEGVA